MKILIILCLAAICLAGKQKLDKKPFHFPGPKNGDAFNLEIGNLYSLNPEKRSESSEEPASEQPQKYGILFNGPKLGENRIVLGFQGYSKPAKKDHTSVPEKQKSASSEEPQDSSVSSSGESSQSSKSQSSSKEAKSVNPVVSLNEENKEVAVVNEPSNDETNEAAANPEVSPNEEDIAAAVSEEASPATPEKSSGDNNNAPAVNEEASPVTPEIKNAPQEKSSSVQDNAPVSEEKNSPKQKNVLNLNQKFAPVPAKFLPFLRANSLRDRRNNDNVRPNPAQRVRGPNYRPLRSLDFNIPEFGSDLRNEGRKKVLGPHGGIEANKQKPRSQRQRRIKH